MQDNKKYKGFKNVYVTNSRYIINACSRYILRTCDRDPVGMQIYCAIAGKKHLLRVLSGKGNKRLLVQFIALDGPWTHSIPFSIRCYLTGFGWRCTVYYYEPNSKATILLKWYTSKEAPPWFLKTQRIWIKRGVI